MNTETEKDSIPVRLGRRQYDRLSRTAKKEGRTVMWLLNLAVDMYFDRVKEEKEKNGVSKP